MDKILNVVDFIQETGRALRRDLGRWLNQLPGWIWDQATSAIGWLANAPGMIASSIWQKVKQLASMIATKLEETLPGFGGSLEPNLPQTSDSTGVGQAPPLTQAQLNNTDRPNVNIALQGGLDAFVERVGRDENVDLF